MNDLRTAAQQALEAFRMCVPMDGRHAEVDAAFRNLRAALAQQAEPVQSTHSAECWQWHHACAVAEVTRLRAEVARLRERSHGPVVFVPKQGKTR